MIFFICRDLDGEEEPQPEPPIEPSDELISDQAMEQPEISELQELSEQPDILEQPEISAQTELSDQPDILEQPEISEQRDLSEIPELPEQPAEEPELSEQLEISKQPGLAKAVSKVTVKALQEVSKLFVFNMLNYFQ